MAQAFADQLTSLVCEGVFERFPQLRIVLIEGGIGWIAPLMWRLDRAWALLRDQAPGLARPPSEVIREHVWLTTQPIDEPARPQDFTAMLEQMDLDDHIVFATDYPHWDFDSPERALPSSVTAPQREAIMSANARALYRFDAGRGDDGA
jgi:predicted TIM-barrel fold metal-dependent hydrolase